MTKAIDTSGNGPGDLPGDPASGPVPTAPAGRRRRRTGGGAWSRYASALRTPKGMAAAVLLLLLVGVAVLAPVIFPGGYDQQARGALAGPSGAHWLGTDEFGRDILTRTVYGLRTDLSLILTAVPVSMVIGTALGLSGYLSKTLGSVTQRILDIILGFPGLILGIMIVLVIGTGWLALFLAIVVAGLPGFGRMARAGLLSEEQREYVMAARVLGVKRSTVMTRHILPNVVDPLLVQASVFMVVAIFIEAGLSIVGLGINPPNPSLGAMLNVGARYVQTLPSYVIGPGVMLLLLALAFTLLSDALNQVANRR
ncbi:ABC transporter permease [Modestobacter roseus]|uniref:Peptide/nickel transport system permease protein n=1 Tax=Modestobacter roseus TaxID=1181884 RepID=A0A562IQT8_9ACTN|nr:ABC transporter permease [Modestobacter roseus]MQA33162.1 ABC transporter permease subunit [Modestobacter roseus]TWH73288.1 peptide/nickel transport system permease protein [Modestobacter roseus]